MENSRSKSYNALGQINPFDKENSSHIHFPSFSSDSIFRGTLPAFLENSAVSCKASTDHKYEYSDNASSVKSDCSTHFYESDFENSFDDVLVDKTFDWTMDIGNAIEDNTLKIEAKSCTQGITSDSFNHLGISNLSNERCKKSRQDKGSTVKDDLLESLLEKEVESAYCSGVHSVIGTDAIPSPTQNFYLSTPKIDAVPSQSGELFRKVNLDLIQTLHEGLVKHKNNCKSNSGIIPNSESETFHERKNLTTDELINKLSPKSKRILEKFNQTVPNDFCYVLKREARSLIFRPEVERISPKIEIEEKKEEHRRPRKDVDDRMEWTNQLQKYREDHDLYNMNGALSSLRYNSNYNFNSNENASRRAITYTDFIRQKSGNYYKANYRHYSADYGRTYVNSRFLY